MDDPHCALSRGHVLSFAAQLLISPKTVEDHRTKIKDELELRGLIGLARYAAPVGVINIQSRGDGDLPGNGD